MSDIYENLRGNLDAYINGFKITDRQTWPKLIRSYALDVIDMRVDNIPPLKKGGKVGMDCILMDCILIVTAIIDMI